MSVQDPGPTAAELFWQAIGALQDAGVIGPLLLKHAEFSSQEFGAIDAEFLAQAWGPLQEPKATVPVLFRQALFPSQRRACDPALTVPVDTEMTKIPQRTAPTKHIRLFMLHPPAPYSRLLIIRVRMSAYKVQSCPVACSERF
jgi:hypothetical protein